MRLIVRIVTYLLLALDLPHVVDTSIILTQESAEPNANIEDVFDASAHRILLSKSLIIHIMFPVS